MNINMNINMNIVNFKLNDSEKNIFDDINVIINKLLKLIKPVSIKIELSDMLKYNIIINNNNFKFTLSDSEEYLFNNVLIKFNREHILISDFYIGYKKSDIAYYNLILYDENYISGKENNTICWKLMNSHKYLVFYFCT